MDWVILNHWWVGFVPGLSFFAIMLIFDLLNRRAAKRTDIWLARHNHMSNLQAACNSGETSLEYHAMRCTWCGNFHPEDDEDCPEKS